LPRRWIRARHSIPAIALLACGLTLLSGGHAGDT
jgi:hypothetical protein